MKIFKQILGVSILLSIFPVFGMIVSVNGKVRDRLQVKADLDQSQVEGLVMNSEKLKPWIGENKPKKIIFVPNKLINIVV